MDNATREHNRRVLERMQGVPMSPLTRLEAMMAPDNPNVYEQNDNEPGTVSPEERAKIAADEFCDGAQLRAMTGKEHLEPLRAQIMYESRFLNSKATREFLADVIARAIHEQRDSPNPNKR